MYAILSHGGRQYRVSAGDRLVVDRLTAEVGSVIALAPVLLTGGDGATALGDKLEGVRVAATVVSHLRGPKIRVFKYKAKKRYRRAAGHRSDLTEVRVESILSKGEALPEASVATKPKPAMAARPAPTRSRTATRAAAAPRSRPAAKPATAAANATATAKVTTKATTPPRSRPVAKDKAAPAATKPASRSTTTPAKPAPKRRTKASIEESGDGA